MQIINRDFQRILKKDDQSEANISDGKIVMYTGIYYLILNRHNRHAIADKASIPTTFIGKVECEKSNHQDGIQGVFITPLYIWSIVQMKWLKIINLNPPTTTYFHYPHLLILPDQYSNHYPLYYIQTCENVSLDEYNHITDTFEL